MDYGLANRTSMRPDYTASQTYTEGNNHDF